MLGRLDAADADGIPRESRDGVEPFQRRCPIPAGGATTCNAYHRHGSRRIAISPSSPSNCVASKSRRDRTGRPRQSRERSRAAQGMAWRTSGGSRAAGGTRSSGAASGTATRRPQIGGAAVGHAARGRDHVRRSVSGGHARRWSTRRARWPDARERTDLRRAHLQRVALARPQHELARPVPVRLLRPAAVVAHPDGLDYGALQVARLRAGACQRHRQARFTVAARQCGDADDVVGCAGRWCLEMGMVWRCYAAGARSNSTLGLTSKPCCSSTGCRQISREPCA